MGRHNAEAQNTGGHARAIANHAHIAACRGIHLRLACFSAVSGGENYFLPGTGIVLNADA